MPKPIRYLYRGERIWMLCEDIPEEDYTNLGLSTATPLPREVDVETALMKVQAQLGPSTPPQIPRGIRGLFQRGKANCVLGAPVVPPRSEDLPHGIREAFLGEASIWSRDGRLGDCLSLLK